MPEYSASQAKNSFGEMMGRAVSIGGVAITRHRTPSAVLLPWEEFESLRRARSESLADLADEFETLLAGMQGAEAETAMEAAFEASPDDLGRAAVEAATRK
jgi:prevent-host-death family protein